VSDATGARANVGDREVRTGRIYLGTARRARGRARARGVEASREAVREAAREAVREAARELCEK